MNSQPAILFNVDNFRTWYPQFGDPIAWTETVLDQYWWNANIYINNTKNPFNFLQGNDLSLCLYAMTAHLCMIADIVNHGEVPGEITSATIDKISATLKEPPERDQWQWWLNITPYGQRLLAVLQVKSVTGFYVPGSAGELAAFRRVGGIFIP